MWLQRGVPEAMAMTLRCRGCSHLLRPESTICPIHFPPAVVLWASVQQKGQHAEVSAKPTLVEGSFFTLEVFCHVSPVAGHVFKSYGWTVQAS